MRRPMSVGCCKEAGQANKGGGSRPTTLESDRRALIDKAAGEKLTGSTEFLLAVECCRSAFARADGFQPIPGDVDWPRFLNIVRFHRVEGLAWRAIANGQLEVPEAVRNSLSGAALAIAATNLRARLECETLRGAFQSNGLRLLFLKGLTVGAIAYGDPGLKAAVDIDLLIDPADLSRAASMLAERGYRLLTPAGGSDQSLTRWHRVMKESVWAKEGALQLDLHTRPADNPALIPQIGANSASQQIEIGYGLALPTLATDELFAYLAVHGAWSSWFRLKWISDFGALLHCCSPGEIERLFARSQELGAGRCAGQALLLSDRLFCSLEGCDGLRQSLMTDRSTRELVRIALHLLTGKPVEPTASVLRTLAIHAAEFLLLPGASFKLSELVAQSRRMVVHRIASWRRGTSSL